MDCSIRANASKYIIRSPKLGTKLEDAPKDGWLPHSEGQDIRYR